MKLLLHNITLLVIGGLFLLGCSKEKRIAKRVDGFWTITSYTITQDSTLEEIELLGLLFSKGNLEFETYDISSSMGEFEMSLNDILADTIVTTSGIYSLSEDGETLTLTIGEEDNPTDVDVTKEKLVIEGQIDGAMAKIEADRT